MSSATGMPSMPARTGTLHVLTPILHPSMGSLLDAGALHTGDLVADLGGFPPAAHRVIDGALVDVTANLVPSRDYWTVARQWLAGMTADTGLQDALAIDGYGFWWTLNGPKFIPALSDLGNTFAWIDLLVALRDKHHPQSVVVYGRHGIILHIIATICPDAATEVRGEAPHPRPDPLVPRKGGLLAARTLIGAAYLLASLVRRPDVAFFSTTTLVRPASDGADLRDVYLDDIAAALRACGRRTVFVEKYGPNASWAALRTRVCSAGGLYFPNDLLFLFSHLALQHWGPFRSLFQQWSARWEAIRDTLPPYLNYRGYDLAPLLMPLIAREFKQHAPNLEIMTRSWRRILRVWQPRLLYISNSYGRSALPAIIAAKTLGIPTIEQQHGVINRDSIPYLVPRAAARESSFPLCDRFIVWGNYFKRLLVDAGVYPPGQVAVAGFPRIDSLLGDLPPRGGTLASLQIPPDAGLVLYTSNEVAAPLMPDLLDGIAQSTDQHLYWVIKLHPRESSRDAWQAGIAHRSLDRVRIVQHEIDFYALLAACDIHASFTSTTLIEAAILGKLNLGLALAQVPDPVGYADARAFLPVAPSQIGPAAERVLNDPDLRQQLAAEQSAFAHDWCLHDGHAVERIVALVKSLIAGEDLHANT